MTKITAHEARELAGPTVQEPVAFVDRADLQKVSDHFEPTISKHPVSEYDVGLYTAPPAAQQKPWVDLQPEQIDELAEFHGLDYMSYDAFTKALIAKLKEANT
jgi:hypothetical protein